MNEQKLTCWQSTRDTNFIGSCDLIVSADENGKPIYQPKTLTIDFVNAREKVLDCQTNKMTEKSVLHFKEKDVKPMILNTTNKRNIELATGTMFLEYWSGKTIMLVVEQIKAFGQVQPALRIKSAPQYICGICGKTISKDIYNASISKYKIALCSKECLEKIQNKEND